jgi:Ca2+-binding RTX toxin-like protein
MTTYNGTSGPDRITLIGYSGSSGDFPVNVQGIDPNGNIINGLAGDDTIYGSLGPDTIDGGDGNDSLFGGNIIYGGAGDDNILFFSGGIAYGGSGNDLISTTFFNGGNFEGNEGDDTIYGSTGFALTGGGIDQGGADTISGNDDNDFAYGRNGADLMFGGNGTDNFEGNTGNDTIFGDDGDDGLAGQEGDDSLVGGNGNDRLYGWLGNDILQGGEGNDSLYGDSGNDQLTGGAGADTFYFGSDVIPGGAFSNLGPDTITDFQPGVDKIWLERFTFSALPVTLSFATVIDDTLAATRNEIVVYSQATGSLFYNANGAAAGFGDGGFFAQLTGNPSITAADFDLLPVDAINGTTGPDRIIISEDAVTTIVNGLAGNDTIIGSMGNDAINGDDGDDLIDGNGGTDILNGGNGNDIFNGFVYNNTSTSILDGGEGLDTLESFSFNGGGSFRGEGLSLDTSNFSSTLPPSLASKFKNIEVLNSLTLGLGFDINTITDSASHNDIIRLSNNGSNYVTTDGGDDQVFIDVKAYQYDRVYSGDGNDSITINSDAFPSTIKGDVLVDSGNGNDRFALTLNKNEYPMILDGGGGTDVLSISCSEIAPIIADINIAPEVLPALLSKIFNNTLINTSITVKNIEFIERWQTGAGNDVITDSGSLGHVIDTQGGDDKVSGGTGTDSIFGSFGNDSISGGAGNDTLYGNDDNDFAYGGTGDDSMFGGNGIDNFEGNEGDDTIFGDEGDDGLAGQEGDDSLVGGNGNDRLYGWLGNDMLIGDADDDTLYGGSGDDQLTGGIGADTFDFGSDFVTGDPFSSLGQDTITDFQSGVDKIQLQRSAFSALPATISFATVADDSLAADRSEIIIYSQATGSLFYNTNGAATGFGDGGIFAQLAATPVITATDFELVPLGLAV